MFYSRTEVKVQSKFVIIMLNLMSELSISSSIIRSGALYQSLQVLDRLFWLRPDDYVVSSRTVAKR